MHTRESFFLWLRHRREVSMHISFLVLVGGTKITINPGRVKFKRQKRASAKFHYCICKVFWVAKIGIGCAIWVVQSPQPSPSPFYRLLPSPFPSFHPFPLLPTLPFSRPPLPLYTMLHKNFSYFGLAGHTQVKESCENERKVWFKRSEAEFLTLFMI